MKKAMLIALTLTIFCCITAKEWFERIEPFPEIPPSEKSNYIIDITQCSDGGYAVLSVFTTYLEDIG
ncbi:MAG: hypothetical protein K8S56_03935 [Candidatus Cloacimonetes bacterium]|nr:hypothetical protein [Candidatus Cloacimonadota bacterium]